jgi:cytosine/uracil/thiamine/allantoin permease
MTGAGDAGHSVAAIHDPATAKCRLSWLGFYGGVLGTIAGVLIAGSFPVNGLIPALKPLYDYSWVVGLGVGFALYLVLSLPAFGRTGDTPAG